MCLGKNAACIFKQSEQSPRRLSKVRQDEDEEFSSLTEQKVGYKRVVREKKRETEREKEERKKRASQRERKKYNTGDMILYHMKKGEGETGTEQR
jgi:bifunctional N-acetylglucosamine-1-phosphate-uridyltransferase/glucosamine-1-phosphate-acetyltransferase GlmU-like protein